MAKATIQTRNETAAGSRASAADQATSAGDLAMGQPSSRTETAEEASPAVPSPQPKVTKLGQVRALLVGPEGASLAQLCAATGWQSHSVRAALTGLRKVGNVIEKSQAENGTTVYRLSVEAEQDK